MHSSHSTSTALIAALLLASCVCLPVTGNPLATLRGMAAHAADQAPAPAPRPAWAASATGRVEPRDGQIVIGTQTPGRVADVAVKINDKVVAGDVLVRLEEEDLMTRASAAAVEVQVRERERDEEVAKGLQLERRQAEDSLSSSERSLFRARLAFDEIAFKLRANAIGSATDVDKARFQINAAKEQLANSRSSHARIVSKDGMPLATRLEASLASARAELALAEAAVERARIRAPIDGTVLNVPAKFGELVAPSPDAPVVVMGDLRSLRVKAEVEERDATKIKIGQRVMLRGDAFPDREFEGTVTSIAQSLAAPRIASRGVRRPNDIEVIEVLIAIDGQPPLLTGMRVDVFFQAEKASALVEKTAAGPAAAATIKTN